MIHEFTPGLRLEADGKGSPEGAAAMEARPRPASRALQETEKSGSLLIPVNKPRRSNRSSPDAAHQT